MNNLNEIKLRAYVDERVRPVVSLLWDNDGIYAVRTTRNTYDPEEYPELTLLRGSGIADDKGKEIFEGDIVRLIRPLSVKENRDSDGTFLDYDEIDEGYAQYGYVEFRGGTFEYNTIATEEGSHEELMEFPLSYLDNVEVIGNIYEDSHLLMKGGASHE